jgi:hypothetical protein
MWPFKKKNKKMISAEKIESLKEYLSKFAKYQWLKTERAGTITEFLNVAVEQDGSVMVEFMDGSRIKYELMNEYILKTNNPGELLEVETPLTPSEKQAIGNGTNVSNVQIRNAPKAQAPDNPIHTLLKKQKPNPVNIDLTLELNIPSANLYSVICGSFDNAEEEIVNYIVSGLDIDTIKESVKDAIKKFYSQDGK